jgi:hypothetical protein
MRNADPLTGIVSAVVRAGGDAGRAVEERGFLIDVDTSGRASAEGGVDGRDDGGLVASTALIQAVEEAADVVHPVESR